VSCRRGDCPWVARAARFVSSGGTPRGTGAGAMRLRRLEAAEVVRTPAGCRPRRGCGVFPGGSRRTVMPSASTSTARALSSSYRRRACSVTNPWICTTRRLSRNHLRGPSSPGDPAGRGGRERQRLDGPAATTASASRSIHPAAPLPRGSIDNDCRHAHSTQRQSHDQNALQTRAVITIRDRPTRPQRTGEAPTRLGVMPHQPERPGPSS
jgi:hypothetical protein